MFKKILVANRGDIALTIIRSCKELDIKTVAVYSSADMESIHVGLADESYCIGPADPQKSYCSVDAILCAALNCGADAVYVGYGFLADSVELSEKCRQAGITFIGASPELLTALADQQELKATLKELAVPTNEKRLRGIPKIIDVQFIADKAGNIVVIGDRDTSYIHEGNRIMGESPAPSLDDKTRKKIYKATKKIVSAYNHVGVGSVIYYIDHEGNHVFLRFVPGLQIGSAISEVHSKIDLVKWQIRIFAGALLTFTEADLINCGTTMGCRIYAINPETNMPSAGEISILHIPGGFGIRIETAIYQNYKLPREYDPMLAKIVVTAGDREETARKLANALREFVSEGVDNNCEIYKHILTSPEFVSGEYDITAYSKLFSARVEY